MMCKTRMCKISVKNMKYTVVFSIYTLFSQGAFSVNKL